ncbi:MAG: helix-turn-helix domain-containing protein [Desulfobacterales bacterium]|jgi:excisionase family DNA binding protein
MNHRNRHILSGTVSVAEAAKMLGVARKTVYDLIEWGELDAVRIRSALRIDAVAVERFRASGKMP